MLASDTRIVQESAHEPLMHSDSAYKSFDIQLDWCAILCGFAGAMERCSAAFSEFHFRCTGLQEQGIEHLEHAWHEAYAPVWMQEAAGPILDRTSLTIEQWRAGFLDPDLEERVRRTWMQNQPPIEMIACGYAQGHSVAFWANGSTFPLEFASVGYAAIGSGSGAALRFLAGRSHHIYRSAAQSLFDLCEAMDAGAADQPATVGSLARYAIARPRRGIEPVNGAALRRWTEHLLMSGVDPDSPTAAESLRRLAGVDLETDMPAP